MVVDVVIDVVAYENISGINTKKSGREKDSPPKRPVNPNDCHVMLIYPISVRLPIVKFRVIVFGGSSINTAGSLPADTTIHQSISLKRMIENC